MQDGLRFEIDKHRIIIRPTVPYSQKAENYINPVGCTNRNPYKNSDTLFAHIFTGQYSLPKLPPGDTKRYHQAAANNRNQQCVTARSLQFGIRCQYIHANRTGPKIPCGVTGRSMENPSTATLVSVVPVSIRRWFSPSSVRPSISYT